MNKSPVDLAALFQRAVKSESECATLRAELDAERERTAEERTLRISETADLRAEVERLRAERATELEAQGRYGFAAAEQLAAANALLGRIGVWADTYGAAIVPHGGAADTYGDGVRACKAQVKAMLSGQPAASRTTAEQRVQDTVAAIPQKDLEFGRLKQAIEMLRDLRDTKVPQLADVESLKREYQQALDREGQLAADWKARYEEECAEHSVTKDRLAALKTKAVVEDKVVSAAKDECDVLRAR